MPQWLGERVSGAVAQDSTFEIDHGGGYRCRSTVQAFAEPSTLGITWQFPDEPATTVSFELDESEGVTDLRLSHTHRSARLDRDP